MSSHCAQQSSINSIIEILRAHWYQFNRNYKETVKYLWALSKKHDFVFPTYKRMAEMCGYSVRTAKNICAKLSQLGLIAWLRRGYRSNLYFLPDDLIKFDFRNRRLLAKITSESCTISCTVLNNIDSSIHVHCDSPSAPAPASPDVPINLEEKRQELQKSFETLPIALKVSFMKEFDFKNGSWIIDRLTEQQIQEILSDLKWFAKKQKVKSYCGLFVKRALRCFGIKGKK